jgi:digeranylgeranylglycerophospholipid reductase
MEVKCDVLVVGAGPAGSMAAKSAAEKGADVILVDMSNEIGYPVRCGEGINKYLFRDTGVKKDKSFICQKIKGARFYFYDTVYTSKGDSWKGYTIDRRVFDKYLAEGAENAGADLLINTKALGMSASKKGVRKVSLIRNRKRLEISARIVIGAGGFDCKVGQWSGIQKPWELDEFSKCLGFQFGNLELSNPEMFHIAFAKEFPNGYGWVFPKSSEVANVGVGVGANANAGKALKFFMNKYPYIRQMLGKSYAALETRAGCIPICGPKSLDEVVSDGVILVGDGAGLVEPITGEGIESSMLSGIAAGETASLCLEKGSCKKRDLGIYEKLWRKKRYIDSNLGKSMDALLSFKKDLDSKRSESEKLIFLEKSIRKI